MTKSKEYKLLDFPKIKNPIVKSSSPGRAADKIFNKLIKEINFTDSKNGTIYLVFYIQDLEEQTIIPYIGTLVTLKNPIVFNKGNKEVTINHRTIVARYDSKMKKVFTRAD